MKCPKCGMENSESRKSCIFCGYEFVDEKEKEEKKKLRIILIRTFGFALVFAVMLILSGLSTVGTFLAVGFIIFYTWTCIKSQKKSNLRPIAKVILTIADIFQCLCLVLGLLWSVDAAAIPDDYTIADLRSAPSEYNITYEILGSLAEGDGIKWPSEKPTESAGQEKSESSELTIKNNSTQEPISEEEDALAKAIKMLTEKNTLGYAESLELAKTQAEGISRIWKGSENYRAIVHDLNKYDQIADLTEPSLTVIIPFLSMLKDLAKIHLLYAPLASERGTNHEITVSLIEFDAVVRKLSLNVRSSSGKIAGLKILQCNICTANNIINHPATSVADVELLAEHFIPLDDELTSMRNPYINDYLILKEGIKKDITQKLGLIGKFPNLSFFKRNSTLRVYRNDMNNQPDLAKQDKNESERKHEKLSPWPDFYPDLGPVTMNSDGEFPWYYEKYNYLGVRLLQAYIHPYERIHEFRTMVQVQDDLLQIVIKARRKRKIDLTARAYTDKYIIDRERNLIYSPGVDQKPFTEDDINLPINPAVIKQF